MRNHYKTIALFLGLSMVAVSCQKEDVFETSSDVESTEVYISVTYFVDDIAMHATFNDESSWQEFLHQMFAMAEEMETNTIGTTTQNIMLMKIVPMGSSAVAPGHTAPTTQPATMPMIMKIRKP